MKKIFLFLIIGVVASLAVVSAGYFDKNSITGNVVNGDEIEGVNSIMCSDKDGGVFAGVPGYLEARKTRLGSAKVLRDSCAGTKENFINSTGGTNKGQPKIREGYCDPVSGLANFIELNTTDLGSGYCVEVKIDDYRKKLAKWISTTDQPICNALDDLGNVVANGERYKVHCSDRTTHVSYACDDTGEFQTITTDCVAEKGEFGICTPEGCIGDCSDTDNTDDINLPGIVTIDGVAKADECNADGRKVKQWKCVNGEARIVPFGNSMWKNCGNNRVCVGSSLGAYCQDEFASRAVQAQVTSVGTTVEQLQAEITALQTTVNALQTALSALQSQTSNNALEREILTLRGAVCDLDTENGNSQADDDGRRRNRFSFCIEE